MGRPREFDIDKAIKTATELFWRKGYEGTSLSDLTGAMHITAPSFYFAFGNKEKLFRKVIEQYYESQMELFEARFGSRPCEVLRRGFSMATPTFLPIPLTHLAVSLSTVLFLVQRTTQFALGSPICAAS